MMINVKEDLMELYAERTMTVTPLYQEIMSQQLAEGLAYTEPVMVGLIETLFRSKTMMAYNLLQNAIDEAKGAARVHLIAERYANPQLKKEMFRHAGDEFRHSRQFAGLIQCTGFDYEESAANDDTNDPVDDILDFDDELQPFVCRVHSIEVRSWVMLRHYLRILNQYDDPDIRAMISTIDQIRTDEIRHVLYTGAWVNRWLQEDPSLGTTLKECVAHTNRETWHDVAAMSNYMADAMADILPTVAAPQGAGRWNRLATA